jgi:hypothetical protein
MDLKWSVPRYKDSVFPRLGGLHIAMNFMKCIGDDMNGSGLHEMWIESDLLGPIAAEQVLFVFIAIISSYISLSLSFKNSNNGGRSNLQRAWEIILCAHIPLV